MSEPHTIPAPELEAAYQALLEGLSVIDLLEIPGAKEAYLKACRDDCQRHGEAFDEDQAVHDLDVLEDKGLVYVIWSIRPLDILLREHFAEETEAVASLVAGHAIVSVSRSQP